ncbi:hypothetical protein ACFFRR_004963 [Megaselia abdita]
MKVKENVLCVLLSMVLFSFSEGKPCPEKTRPHKTRCDAYFKCKILPSKNHVWVPETCEKGLIYEPNLKICVLPEDDWECTLGDTNVVKKDDDNTIYEQDLYSKKMKKHPEKAQISNDTFDQIEIVDSDTKNLDSSSEEDTLEPTTESSGDGAEEVELEMREDIDSVSMKIPLPTLPTPSSKIDPNLTAHLQRLSQLIDGLKQTYQKQETPSAELRPDQLNAFLAHHNIKSEFNVIPMSVNKTVPAQSLTMKPNVVSVVLNRTNYITPVNNSSLNPETKVLMTNYGQTRRHGDNVGYSNSQIVVNRPEGSVVFALPSRSPYEEDYSYQQHKPYKHEQQMYNDQNYHSIVNDEPKISEDTLKTVLELSKQMLANQNIRQVYPANNFYPSVLQPIYYPMPSQQPIQIKQENPQGSKPSTIIHNNVIPLHLSNSGKPLQNSYGNQIEQYPPFHSESHSEKNSPFSSNVKYGSSEEDNDIHYYDNHRTRRPPNNRYENNKYVSSKKDEEYYNSGFSTPQPPVIDASHSSFNNYYTPHPHLDEENIHQVFKVNRYNYGGHDQYHQQQSQKYQQQQYHRRPPPPEYSLEEASEEEYSEVPRPINPNRKKNPYRNTRPLVFPSQINPSHISVRPNSYKTSSGEISEDDMVIPHSSSEEESHSIFNENRRYVNNQKKIVNDELTQNIVHNNIVASKKDGNGNANQLVNLGGNFISYDVFKNQLLPALNVEQGNANVEVINCAPGVRQANITDCTKYYVCSKRDGKVLSYSCPPFTGFNEQSRICDAKTYAMCNPHTEAVNEYSVSDNRRKHMEALSAMGEVQKLREQLLAQSMLHHQQQQQIQPSAQEILATMSATITTRRPSSTKRRKYFCREGDKIPDQTSINNYFVCYKLNGVMKGHRMSCSKGLVFCPSTTMCTLPNRCS